MGFNDGYRERAYDLQRRAKSLSHSNSSFLVQEEDIHNAETTPAPDRAVMVSNAWPIASSRTSLVLAPARRKAVLSLENASSMGERSGE
jgi:hypothetical protein